MNILEEAASLVDGDRQQDYGHPRDDYGRVAKMATEVLHKKLKEPLDPEDCILFMFCIKLSRLSNKYKRDSAVDMAGYSRVLEMIMEDDPLLKDGDSFKYTYVDKDFDQK